MDAISLPPAQKRLALVGVLLGMLLAALDNTIVSTAGPSIQRDLGIEPGLYVWITTSYLVASTVLVPIWGKLSDSIGRRKVLLAGIAVFLLGSVLCAVSQNAIQLILFRAVQGMGSASLFTSAFAILGDMYEARERGKLNGFFGAVFGLSSVVGPLVGGFLTDNFGWHWCFLVNVPVGIIAIAFILARMPPLLPRGVKDTSIDIAGAVFLALAVVPLLIALSFGKAVLRAGETGYLWTSWQELALFGASLVGFVAFLLVERAAKSPIVDLKLFSNRAFAMGSLAAFAAGLTFLGAIVFLPLFMQNVVGERATGAGLTTLPLTFGIVFGNIGAGQATARTGKYKPFIVGAIALSCIAFGILAFTLDIHATKLSVSWKMFLIGLGVGPAIPLFALAIQNAVAPQFIGVASSMATFSRQMGATIGIAILGTVFSTTLSDGLAAKMKVATEGVPEGMLQQFQHNQSEASAEGESPKGAFDRAAIEQNVHRAFGAQRALVVAALKDNDAAAVAALKADARVDARLRTVLAAGGIGAQVQAGFDATFAKLTTAAQAGPDAIAALKNDPSMPAPLVARLNDVPPGAWANPQARDGILAGIKTGMQAAAADATAKAIDAAIDGAHAGLTAAEAQAIATVGKVELALKESFTDAVKRVYVVCMLLAALALLVSFLLPALPLRQAGAAPPSE